MPDDFGVEPDEFGVEPDSEFGIEPDHAPISTNPGVPAPPAPLRQPQDNGVVAASPAGQTGGAPTGFLNQYLPPPPPDGPNQSIGQPAETPDIPTLSQGSPEPISGDISHQLAINKFLEQSDTLKDATQKVRAGLNTVTSNIAPYALAGMDTLIEGTPFSVGLHQWNQMYQQAVEDQPVAANVGGLAQAALPFSRLKLLGNIGVGAASSALSTYLGSEMQASGTDLAKAAALGGGLGGLGYAGMGQLGEAGKYMLGNKRAFVPDIAPKGGYRRGAVNGMLGIKQTPEQLLAKYASRTYIKPIVLDMRALGDLEDTILRVEPESTVPQDLMAQKTPKGLLDTTHSQSLVAEAVKQAEPNLPVVLQQLAKDPASVPRYTVDYVTDLRPVAAHIDIDPEGFAVNAREVSGKGVGVFREPIRTLKDAVEFSKQWYANHPDTPLTASPAAQTEMSDEMFNTLFKRPIEEDIPKPRPSAPSTDKTNPGRPITVEAEAPASASNQQPGLVGVDREGYLSVSKLNTLKAQGESLLGRNIRAITTPKGTRYVRALGDADTGFASVAPFDPEEGIKTVRRVSRVPQGQLRGLTKNELRKLVKEAKEFRETSWKPHQNPDVHVDPGSKSLLDYSEPTNPRGEMTRVGGGALRERTTMDQPMAMGDGAMTPPKPPPPPGMEPMPPPDPPTPPPPFDEPVIKTQNTLMKSLGGLYQKARREMVFEGLRADYDFSQLINDKKSINNLQNHQVTVQRALERGLGKNITKFREDIYEWANARLTDEYMAEKYPQQWMAKRQMLMDFQRTRDAQHARIQELGGIPDNTFSQEEGDLLLKKYVTRSYALQTLPPGKRLEILLRDQKGMQRAVDGYVQWAKDNHQTLSEADARGKVIDALRSEDPASLLFGADAPPSPMPGDNLRYRKNLPEWYREMLGENKDGFYAIARTDAVQKSIIANLQVWEAVANNPEWARTTLDGLPPEIADQWKTLPDNRRWFGKASGMKVAPEVYDSLVTLANATYEANKVATAIIKIQKANWFSLGRMRTYVATMLDNFAYGMLAGGVDPLTRPYATGQGMGYATKGMLEYRKNPLADNEFATFIRDARRIGVDEPGHIGTDSSLIAKRQELHFYEKMAKLDNVNYATWATKAAEAHAAITKPGSWVFETSDRLHRLASWKMITDDLMKAGLTDRELAMRQAARQIFRYYPMYGRAAPAANWLSKGAAGLAAPTAMFKMERNRVWGSIPFRMVDDPKVMFRLLKMGVVFKGLLGANDAMRNALGEVSDEEVAAAYQEQGLPQKMFAPGMLILPVKVGGKVQPLDYTAVAGPLQYLQGDPRLGNVAKTLLNASYGPFEGGMAGVAIGSVMDQAGVKTGLDSRPPPPGTNPLINMGQQVIDRGGIPAIIPEVYNNFANTGAMGSLNRKQEQWPMSAAIARTMGVPLTTPVSAGADVNPSFQSAMGDDLGKIKEAERYVAMAAQMKPDQKVKLLQFVVDGLQGTQPGANRDAIMKAAIEQIKEAALNMGKTGRMEEAARNSVTRVIRSDDNSQLPVKVIKQ